MKWKCEGMVNNVDQMSLSMKKMNQVMVNMFGTVHKKSRPCDKLHGWFPTLSQSI